MNADAAWEEFLDADCEEQTITESSNQYDTEIDCGAPQCSPIYISTKTKIAYLNSEVPLERMFWALPVHKSYSVAQEGIIKKEMKFKSLSQEALQEILDNVAKIPEGPVVEQQIKLHLNKDDGNVRFKDIRKISVGLCKKQLTSFRTKAKGAFFNCFAVILRVLWDGNFREMHIKVFNTGKLEIPGIPGERTDEFLHTVLTCLVNVLKPLSNDIGLEQPLDFNKDCNETVLTNSNFSANYLIDREMLTMILKTKYRILSTYDPCSYPGVQSKFYYVPSRAIQNGRPLSEEETDAKVHHIIVPFMIFRTGSALIVGKFDDNVLHIVYEFATSVLRDEYNLVQAGVAEEKQQQTQRKRKKRFVMMPKI